MLKRILDFFVTAFFIVIGFLLIGVIIHSIIHIMQIIDQFINKK